MTMTYESETRRSESILISDVHSLELSLLLVRPLPQPSGHLPLYLLDLELRVVQQFLLSVRADMIIEWTLWTRTIVRSE